MILLAADRAGDRVRERLRLQHADDQTAERAGEVGSIETQLQRRADLIPNSSRRRRRGRSGAGGLRADRGGASRLLNATRAARRRGAATRRRNRSRPSSKPQQLRRHHRRSCLWWRIPGLEIGRGLHKFQDELAGTENRIAVSRETTTARCRTTTRARAIPDGHLGKDVRLQEEPLFKADEGARQAPQINSESCGGTRAVRAHAPARWIPPRTKTEGPLRTKRPSGFS